MNKAHYLDIASPRGPSPLLWGGINFLELLDDPEKGYFFWDDFIAYLETGAGWTETQATTGTVAGVAEAGGAIDLDSNSTTADQGIQLQQSHACFLPALGTELRFEARLKVTDTIDKVQFFAGLAALDTTVFATGENSTDNHIGFEIGATIQAAANAGKAQFYGEKATVRGTVADVHTFVEATYVTLGFKVTELTKIEIYVNNVKHASTLLTANIPTAAVLTPTFCCLSEGTNDPIVRVDWVRVAATALGSSPRTA